MSSGKEVLRREREETVHPNPADRRDSKRCDGVYRADGGDRARPWAMGAEQAHGGKGSALFKTTYPQYETYKDGRGGDTKLYTTTNQVSELEKTMFPEDSQLPAFKTVDTLRITGCLPDGSSHPLEDTTTTGDLGKDSIVSDITLHADQGWAAHTALVPSAQSLAQRRQDLAEQGRIVVLPPHQEREDKLQNAQAAHTAKVSVMTASYYAPPGFVPTNAPVDNSVEVKYRRGKSNFEGDSGRPEMYNR